jgi:hypothetical protein
MDRYQVLEDLKDWLKDNQTPGVVAELVDCDTIWPSEVLDKIEELECEYE